MSNIYNIQQDLLAILGEIEDNEGEITPEIEEKLSIKQEEFKDKIKSYSGIIKSLTADINAIKEERDRLYDYQKSKEKTIERLKKIVIEAIEMFGDTTRSGSKFVDYGTGKISVRTNQAVDVDNASVDRFVNRLVLCFKWYYENNQLSSELLHIKDILDWINDKSPSEDINNEEINKFDIKDIERLNASIDFDVDIKSLMSTEDGIDLIRALLKHNIFKISAKADKKGIKEDAKGESHFMPIYAKLVNNKTITIK